MKETLAHLLELQEVDNALDELRRARETYPKRIDELRKELEEERTSLEELKGKLQELERQKRHYERELRRAQDELEKHKARLYEVKTNREYDAVQQEIEAWENSIGQNEEFLLDTMAAIEELTPQVADKEQAYARSRQEKQEEIENLLAKLGSLEEELVGYLKRREEITGSIDRRLLATYERVRRGRGGVAVVPVTRGACGGCFSQLPPQVVVEVRRGDRLIRCEYCGRILVWNEEQS